MIKHTKNYDMFKFREDNREKINQNHVKRLISSISSRNLLNLRPICVNGLMEIIDGQHRLMAAKSLGVEIYYEVKDDLDSADIILMNTSKSWGIHDYMNFYIKNGYPEYIKLQNILKQHNLTLKVALYLILGGTKEEKQKFKSGQININAEIYRNEVENCWTTINIIKRLNGPSQYTSASKFWIALMKLAKHPEFDEKKWFNNLEKLISRIGPRASSQDYEKLFSQIYNWKNTIRIEI